MTGLLAVLCIFTGLFALSCLFTGWKFIHRHHPLRVLFRLGTGHHLDGSDRCNRTWTRAGTYAAGANSRAHVSWLARRSRAWRAAAFWLSLLSGCYLANGLAANPAATLAVVKAAAAVLAALAVWRGARLAARHPHRRAVVNPLAAALAGHMRWSPAVVAENLRIRPLSWHAEPGDVVAEIRALPDHYAASPADQDWVETLLRSRLPWDIDFTWQTSRHPMRVVVTCASAPPKQVTAAESLNVMLPLGYGQYFLGRSANGIHEIWDATAEDPHMMIGGRSRRGKTNVLLAVIAQGLRRGERFTAIDPKRVSLTCLAGVPGFTLASDPRDVASMWQVIAAFRAEMDAEIDGLGDGVPHTLVLEEANQLFALFRAHWDAVKPPGARVMDLPAWQDVRAVLHQGAQFGYRVLVGGQDLTAQVLFGSRHSFGMILMTGFTRKQWAYAVGTTPVPPSPVRKGRFHLVRASDHTTVQVVCGDPRGGVRNEQAWRVFALAGRTAPQPRQQQRKARLAPLPLTGRQPPPAIPLVLIGAKAAADYLGMTYGAFRIRRRRHPIPGEFTHRRRGQATSCWHADTLRAWAAGPVQQPGTSTRDSTRNMNVNPQASNGSGR